ncbi:hypothetical protein ACFQDZ_21145 [Sulfitobacter pacificus]|uniref:hypothetical protein n=2 Tax=Sulfitobacter pacificus TaxID=1499314 RepID=UPI00360B122A
MTIGLSGPMCLVDSTGASRLPKSAKARGLLALLSTIGTLSRPRPWLQEMLWSDRSQPQRSASLRQALSDLRRCLGPYADVLISDRQSVALDPARVLVRSAPCSPQAEFLQGLKVADPAFTAWLAEQRLLKGRPGAPAASEKRPAHCGPKTIVLLGETDDGSVYAGLELAFNQVVTHSLREHCDVLIGSPGALPLRPDCVLMSVKAATWANGKTRISVTVEDIGTNIVCWSGSIELPDVQVDPFDNVPFLALCNRATEATLEARINACADLTGPKDAGQIAHMALRKLFAITAQDVSEALRLFDHAYAINPQPVFQAWRAQAMTIQYVERFVPLDQTLREQAEAACRLALQDGSGNATVLAAVANTRTNIDRNYGVGLELALQSVQVNPANVMAWYAYSNAVQCLGRSEEAYQAALVAQALAQTTRMKFWADCQVSITAATSGRSDVAIRFGERAHALSPGFRPPLRYLTALYALNARPEDVSRTVASLRREEPDFDLVQMTRNPDYPIGIMRRYGRKLTDSLRRAGLE